MFFFSRKCYICQLTVFIWLKGSVQVSNKLLKDEPLSPSNYIIK